MSDTPNPFAFWQQFWQTATPQMAAFIPPTNLEEVNRKINELRNVEVWLNFNLQAVQTQLMMLAQQKSFFEHIQSNISNVENSDDNRDDDPHEPADPS